MVRAPCRPPAGNLPATCRPPAGHLPAPWFLRGFSRAPQDDGFCYWRWFEYSLSASLMAMAIALALGLREQNILAGIFMLHWSTMMFGFLVE